VVIDHRTDIYSLGATHYELVTLQPAFSSNDRQELLRQIAFEEPRRPRRLNRAIPTELEIIVLKALEKYPADRYAKAQEMADDLRRYLEDKPIMSRPPLLWARTLKWGRRHPAAVWAATIVLVVAMLALTATVAVTLYQKGLTQEALNDKTKALEGRTDALNQRTEALNEKTLALNEKTLALNDNLGQLEKEGGRLGPVNETKGVRHQVWAGGSLQPAIWGGSLLQLRRLTPCCLRPDPGNRDGLGRDDRTFTHLAFNL
jgi:serine/threonine protein kinase